MAEPVIYALSERIAQLTINRPESLNSLDLATVESLIFAAKRAVDEGANVLLLTGSGRAFCSGADLSGALGNRDEDGTINIGRPMRSHYNPLIETLSKLEIPVVVAVNGIAAGGGVSLALCGDIVIAARSASFRQTFADIGLIPDMGATWLVPRLVGRARARSMALLGEAVSAEAAKQMGLIWDVVDDQMLATEARRIATQLSMKSQQALRAARRALDLSYRFELTDQLAIEARMQSELGRQPEFSVAVEKFLAHQSSAKSKKVSLERRR